MCLKLMTHVLQTMASNDLRTADDLQRSFEGLVAEEQGPIAMGNDQPNNSGVLVHRM